MTPLAATDRMGSRFEQRPGNRRGRLRTVLGLGLLLFAAGWSQGAELTDTLREQARPLRGPSDVDTLLEAAASARVVLMGEATHGTREFYQWRALLTQRLIAEQGVRLVGVEGDWRPLLELNSYLSGENDVPDAATALRRIDRWPEWMWRNAPFAELLDWIRDWNRDRLPHDRVRLYGLDLYGHEDSLTAVEAFVRRWMPVQWKVVRKHYSRFRWFDGDGQAYTNAIREGGPSARPGTHAVLELLRSIDPSAAGIPEELLRDAVQDAFVVANAEHFYRVLPAPEARSWNVRATHLWSTLHQLLERHGPDSRAVAWAHNTHVGDARATDMRRAGLVNLGHLSRETLGAPKVFIVGFATYRGEVMAGRAWGSRPRVMPLPIAREGSWDEQFQSAVGKDSWWLFDHTQRTAPGFSAMRPQRAIGVVYVPRHEPRDNYTQTILPQRFDAVLFLSHTHAIEPLR